MQQIQHFVHEKFERFVLRPSDIEIIVEIIQTGTIGQ